MYLYSPPDNPEKQVQEILTDARNLFGLSGEFIGAYLRLFNQQNDYCRFFSLCHNYFQMEHRLNLQLNEMGEDILNYQYPINMIDNTKCIPFDFVNDIKQFLLDIETGHQQLIIYSPNKGKR